MKIVAFIPVKLNNDRLPGKNTKMLGNKPLIQYQLEELLKIRNELNSINVYCSSPSIASLLPNGINLILRPEFLDGSKIKGNQIYSEFIKKVDSDFYLLVHATAPFVKAESILRMITEIKTGRYDSAFAAYKIQKFLWQNTEPLNFNIADVPRTQDLQPIYVDQCGPYLFSKKLFVEHSRRIGFHPFIQELSLRESIDIDTEDDFQFAEKFV